MVINTKQPGDKGYVAFYHRKRCEVYAPNLLKARDAAAKYFKARKAYDVSVMLAETADGAEVTHTADW